ncbi:hypothetical protein ASZ90_008282 [hydrocarbon metagenome]|uniref:Uncharacterized protein n=1 Tax=hydrocarbon metagenome TaxID=938273 RepID=A0A0W8FNN2_9ZZZZ
MLCKKSPACAGLRICGVYPAYVGCASLKLARLASGAFKEVV